ncbi:hypothetical protein [Fibrobacter sp.]|uniref:hypothetical protein n=1 Tax=Fibrobacter sp. TaxID=35828 RepID=UPI003869AB73
MVKKFCPVIALFLVSLAAASDISWKTFDVKFGPALGSWTDASTMMFGGSLSLVKPITPYIGAGVMAEFATDVSACEDCDDYDFDEFSGGLLLNLKAPISNQFSLVANFMFLVTFRDGTVDELYFFNSAPIEAYDAEGNRILTYTREKDNHDYYFESFMFRSNLGVSWRTKSEFFELEFYPLDFAVVRGGDARMTFSLNAVFRVF